MGISPRFLASENWSPCVIIRCCLRDPAFSHFGTVPACDRRMDTHDNSIYCTSIMSYVYKDAISFSGTDYKTCWSFKTSVTVLRQMQYAHGWQETCQITVHCWNRCLTLPKWEKYHGFHCEELHLGVISTQQFFGGDVEEEESIEGESDADVVDNCYVQVSMMSPIHSTNVISDIQQWGCTYNNNHCRCAWINITMGNQEILISLR